MRWRAAAAALCAICAGPLMPTGLVAMPNGLAALAVGDAGWIAGTEGCAAGPADRQRERDRRELKEFAAGMAPRHAREYFDELRRRERQRGRAERQQREDAAPPLWPFILEDSARWLDKSPEEREELRRRERAEQGVGRGGMWLDDQTAFEQFVDDWLATREMLGLSYDGDVTKEPEVPKPISKTMKKIIKGLQDLTVREPVHEWQ